MSSNGCALTVQMSLRHVVYVSYLLPASRMRPFVPGILPLTLVDSDQVFLSVVLLRSEDVRMAWLPAIGFGYNQVNVRTYVTDPQSGQPGVYFIRSGVTSRVVSLLTCLFGLSWEKMGMMTDRHRLESSYVGGYRAFGVWQGDFAVSAEPGETTSGQLYPFADLEAAANYLVRPMIGFFSSSGNVRKFNIAHGQLEPTLMRLSGLYFPMLADSGMLPPDEWAKPHNVLSIPESRFSIFLPPSKVL